MTEITSPAGILNLTNDSDPAQAFARQGQTAIREVDDLIRWLGAANKRRWTLLAARMQECENSALAANAPAEGGVTEYTLPAGGSASVGKENFQYVAGQAITVRFSRSNAENPRFRVPGQTNSELIIAKWPQAGVPAGAIVPQKPYLMFFHGISEGWLILGLDEAFDAARVVDGAIPFAKLDVADGSVKTRSLALAELKDGAAADSEGNYGDSDYTIPLSAVEISDGEIPLEKVAGVIDVDDDADDTDYRLALRFLQFAVNVAEQGQDADWRIPNEKLQNPPMFNTRFITESEDIDIPAASDFSLEIWGAGGGGGGGGNSSVRGGRGGAGQDSTARITWGEDSPYTIICKGGGGGQGGGGGSAGEGGAPSLASETAGRGRVDASGNNGGMGGTNAFGESGGVGGTLLTKFGDSGSGRRGGGGGAIGDSVRVWDSRNEPTRLQIRITIGSGGVGGVAGQQGESGKAGENARLLVRWR